MSARETLVHESVVYHAVKKVLCDDDWPNLALEPIDLRNISRRLLAQLTRLNCCDNGSFARKHNCLKRQP